jgi:hypothetical protein
MAGACSTYEREDNLYWIIIFSRYALDFQGPLHPKNFPVVPLLTQSLVIQGELEVISGSLVKLFGVPRITGSVHEKDLSSDPMGVTTSVYNK